MNEYSVLAEVNSMQKLKAWLTAWPSVRKEIQSMIAAHARRDPSLHFELTLAEIQLRDIDETMQHAEALGRLLHADDLTPAELEATGNR